MLLVQGLLFEEQTDLNSAQKWLWSWNLTFLNFIFLNWNRMLTLVIPKMIVQNWWFCGSFFVFYSSFVCFHYWDSVLQSAPIPWDGIFLFSAPNTIYHKGYSSAIPLCPLFLFLFWSPRICRCILQFFKVCCYKHFEDREYLYFFRFSGQFSLCA